MTYWFTAYCEKCKCESPPLFVTSFSKVSIYPFDQDEKRLIAGQWVEEHAFHNPIILHEDDETTREKHGIKRDEAT